MRQPCFFDGGKQNVAAYRSSFRAFFIILIEYMIISMLYTYMIFPGFGL